jgi:hypothetical protein
MPHATRSRQQAAFLFPFHSILMTQMVLTVADTLTIYKLHLRHPIHQHPYLRYISIFHFAFTSPFAFAVFSLI